MAQEAGDGLSLNEDRPDIDQPHGYDYRELQHIKKGMRIRLEKEHNAAAATLATNSAGGEHLNGSAVAYEGSSEPSKRPDTSTDLADNAYDRGRLWLDDNYDPPVLKRWDGSAWEVIGRMLVDDESLVVYLSNEKQENIDGGRETKLIFKGVKADGTAHELAMIQVSHDGTGDDYKSDIILYANDGDDAAGSLTEVLRIDSAKLATFAGAITATGVITNSEIPVFTKGVVANDTYLQGRNSADDGNVDMMKVGRNEADDTDVVQLPDKVRTASNAAPTEDTQIANKKYVDDNVGAKNYTPNSYAGEESVTFPNGLIMKQGTETVAAYAVDDVTYASAFPNAVVSIQLTDKYQAGDYNEGISAVPKAGSVKSIFQIKNWTSRERIIYWQVWGY